MTGWWAKQFGTPNFAAHGGFCSVNMAAAGLYSVGGSFWEFGDPDWDRTKYFLMFGVAEDHDSNPIKSGLAKLKQRGAKYVSVNPVRTGYSAIADEWIGIRPGTDGLFVLALVHELLRTDRIDLDFLVRYTNALWLVIRNPGAADDGLFVRDTEGRPLAWDRASNAADRRRHRRHAAADRRRGETAGRPHARCRCSICSPSAIWTAAMRLKRWPIAAACRLTTIRRIAAGDCGNRFRPADRAGSALDGYGRPATRDHDRPAGRDARDARNFGALQRVPHLPRHPPAADAAGRDRYARFLALQIALSAADAAGATPGRPGAKPMATMSGMALGYPRGPEDLLLEDDGAPSRIDKAFSWDAPIGAHGLMHTLIANAYAGDPYKIDTLFMYMANMAWNSSMNPGEASRMMTDKDPATGEYRIPHIIYSDAYY